MLTVLLVALVACASALINPDMSPLIDEDLVRRVKESGAQWEATLDNKFASWTLGDAKKILGARLDDIFIAEAPVVDAVTAVPANFDARQQWPGAIHPIRNQEQCGSCWAFGATESLSDRFAIQSNLSTNTVLSPQQLVSCNTGQNLGCNGGYPILAWQYMQATGVVTDACYPYTSGGGVTGNCLLSSTTTTCPGGSGTVQYYNAATAYAVGTTVAAIQTEIYTNGPIEVAFDVYQDFFSYTSGVYVHTTGSLAGGHAVKMIGWGTLSGTPYWTCSNSWGTSWGMQGFFLIESGVDECGIESAGTAGLAQTSSF